MTFNSVIYLFSITSEKIQDQNYWDKVASSDSALFQIFGFSLLEEVLSPKLCVDVPAGPWNIDSLYTNFSPNLPPFSIPFSKEKHPILLKLSYFCHNLLKIHPIYVIWAPSSLMKTHRLLYQISRNSIPKGRHIYVYHVNVRTPPPEFLSD